ncbi:hypothetical protein N9393_01325 [Luminiphilus sp.]|nr:hypothetical protein [Luminiphilus sp.]
MKRFFKIIGALISGLIVLAAVVLAGLYGYDQYKQNTFKPIEEVDGVYLGMPRGDLLFKTRLDMRCSPEETDQTECELFRFLNPSSLYGYSKNDRFISHGNIRLKDDKVVALSKHLWIPRDLETQVYNTDALVKKLGDPDVLVVSKDLTSRHYMYVDQKLVFTYSKDSLSSINWGESSIRDLEISVLKRWEVVGDSPDRLRQTYVGAEVIVDGRRICPSEDCPFEVGDTFPHASEMTTYSAEEMLKLLSD